MNDDDKELERRIAELRAWDLRRTPSFDAVRQSSGPRRVRWVTLAAAATLATLLLFVGLRFRSHDGERVRWLVEWQSPTASLLTVPGPDLASAVPSISTS